MKEWVITARCSQDSLGGVMEALLNNKATHVEFHQIEDVPYSKNKPRTAGAKKKKPSKGVSSRSPETSYTGVVHQHVVKMDRNFSLNDLRQKITESHKTVPDSAIYGVLKKYIDAGNIKKLGPSLYQRLD